MKKLVIIPTYNEKENIENIISAVFALEEDFHVLIVDDSSPDGTAEIVKNLQKIYPHELHLSIRKVKDGLGLDGRFRIISIIFSKWMPIFHTTQKILTVFTKPA